MRRHLPPLLLAIAGVVWVVVFLILQEFHLPDVPDVGTPPEAVDAMLELAGVRKDDLVYDLGCGDGRIVVAAAHKYGCRAAGFDIDPKCVSRSQASAAENGVQDLVTIRQGDIFKLDLRPATVITLFLKTNLNAQLIPQLEQLPDNVRIVSYQFRMPGVVPRKVIQVDSRPIYLWVTPLKFAEDFEPSADDPFPYDLPPWGVTAAAVALAFGVWLLLSRSPSALLAAGVGAAATAGLAWWALGSGRGYMVSYVQTVCSSVLALVGAAGGWMAASLGKAAPKQPPAAAAPHSGG